MPRESGSGRRRLCSRPNTKGVMTAVAVSFQSAAVKWVRISVRNWMVAAAKSASAETRTGTRIPSRTSVPAVPRAAAELHLPLCPLRGLPAGGAGKGNRRSQGTGGEGISKHYHRPEGTALRAVFKKETGDVRVYIHSSGYRRRFFPEGWSTGRSSTAMQRQDGGMWAFCPQDLPVTVASAAWI